MRHNESKGERKVKSKAGRKKWTVKRIEELPETTREEIQSLCRDAKEVTYIEADVRVRMYYVWPWDFERRRDYDEVVKEVKRRPGDVIAEVLTGDEDEWDHIMWQLSNQECPVRVYLVDCRKGEVRMREYK